MPTDQPVLTAAWTHKGNFALTWTHSGSDIFGWSIHVWTTGTTNYLVANQSYNTALRTYLVPEATSFYTLAPNTSYSAKVTALSLSGHVASREARLLNGTQVSHTFFDGPIYIWPEHDQEIIHIVPEVDTLYLGDYRFLPSMDFAHLAHGQLPSDFLPVDAIPLAVTGGVRYGAFAMGTAEPGISHYITTKPQLFGRPLGFTPAWETTPDVPVEGTITGAHADAEWLLPTGADENQYKTIDPIHAGFNESDYPTQLDPHTDAPWTRANILSYYWGWAWYAWSGYNAQADRASVLPPPFHREMVTEGRLSMFKVYVDYAFPATYDDTPPPPPAPPPEAPSPPLSVPSYALDERLIRRLRRAPHLTQEHVRVFYRRFELDLERGVGLVTGQGEDPLVMLRLSRDGGHTWGEPVTLHAGRIGDYTARVIARRLGQARDMVFEVTVSDPVAWSLVGAWLSLEPGSS